MTSGHKFGTVIVLALVVTFLVATVLDSWVKVKLASPCPTQEVLK
jgi:hypothetical protein